MEKWGCRYRRARAMSIWREAYGRAQDALGECKSMRERRRIASMGRAVDGWGDIARRKLWIQSALVTAGGILEGRLCERGFEGWFGECVVQQGRKRVMFEAMRLSR